MKIDETIRPAQLQAGIERMFEVSAGKIDRLERRWNPRDGGPVFTAGGIYTTRGWTEWTQGFQYGSALLQYEAGGDARFLESGSNSARAHLTRHLTHTGVHDHGFHAISSFGTLLRMVREGKASAGEWERRYLELALMTSGAVQAARWTALPYGEGFIHSFNGPHSLFADSMRTLRSLAVAHALGHVLMSEREERVNLLHRLIRHGLTTARYAVYYGQNRDAYDVRGRVAHESIFSTADGSYRCPSTQQGYSPFSTWMRGLAWVLLGYAETLEFLATRREDEFDRRHPRAVVFERFEHAARAAADFYIDETPSDGIPYWDSGAPGLAVLGDYRARPADPFNDHEPVDSSAAAIAAQGLLRLGYFLRGAVSESDAMRYVGAGLTTARALFSEPYLSTDPDHEGLILHSVYHRPAGWDRIPDGRHIPCGESSMWGDYHARELGLTILRSERGEAPLRFFSCAPDASGDGGGR